MAILPFLNARDAFVRRRDITTELANGQPSGNHEPLAPYADGCFACGWKGRLCRRFATSLHADGSYVRRETADWIRWLASGPAERVDAEFPACFAPSRDVTAASRPPIAATTAMLAEADKSGGSDVGCPEPYRPVLDALVASQAKTADDVRARARRQVEINRPARPGAPETCRKARCRMPRPWTAR